ncbi:type II secretion system F family protein [Aquihabitans sp. McL0605]|uniref:type II secretion system F family protein n=1 Tax=Aquihabitans sp. McL0605 TaxID=3415671 RepID=UPI003CECE9E6
MRSPLFVGVLAALLVAVTGALARRAAAASVHRSAGALVASIGREWAIGTITHPLAVLAGSEPAGHGEPTALLHLRTAIERGASLGQAFEAVAGADGPWDEPARRLIRRCRAGASVQEALDQWVDEDPDPTVALLADALAIASATGGSQVRAIDAVIDAVRDRAALRREVRALASQARSSAVVLVVMPLAFAVAVSVLDPRVRAFTFGSPLGPLCIFAGSALDGAGGWWMHRLVRSVA